MSELYSVLIAIIIMATIFIFTKIISDAFAKREFDEEAIRRDIFRKIEGEEIEAHRIKVRTDIHNRRMILEEEKLAREKRIKEREIADQKQRDREKELRMIELELRSKEIKQEMKLATVVMCNACGYSNRLSSVYCEECGIQI